MKLIIDHLSAIEDQIPSNGIIIYIIRSLGLDYKSFVISINRKSSDPTLFEL